MIIEIEMMPFPADDTLLVEGEQYLAVDDEGKHHILRRQGEHLMLDGGGEPATEAEEADLDDVNIVWVAALPEMDKPEQL